MRAIVIHCLPGFYGRKLTTPIDSRSIRIGQTQPSAVVAGVLHPPGTWWNVGPIPGKSWLWPGVATAQFGPFGPGGAQYSTIAWGIGDAQGVDQVRITNFFEGQRYNCQLNYGNGTFSNLQTFLGIDGPRIGLKKGRDDPRRKKSFKRPTLKVIQNAARKIKLRR